MKGLSRREFIKGLVGLGCASVFVAGYAPTIGRIISPKYQSVLPDEEGRILHSACLGCNVRCGIRINILKTDYGEVVERISGNPYHPYNRAVGLENQTKRYFSLPYHTPLKEALNYTGTICGKGEDGIHYLYDPYRILTPLKRSGARGSGKFKVISWEQLIKEVTEGGIIEETGEKIPGLREIFVYGKLKKAGFDPVEVLSEMKKDVDEIKSKIKAKEIADKEALRSHINSFKEKWQKKLSGISLHEILINPERPDLGTKANQVIFYRGRGQAHADYFYRRWIDAFGSVNWLRHTSSCQLGYYAANKLWAGVTDLQMDVHSSKVIVMAGAQMGRLHPGATGQGLLIERAALGELKIYYVNPTAPRTSANGNIVWVPVKPGTDAALAMAILRVMFEKGWYNSHFLSIPNKKAAEKAKQPVYTNATWLVILDGEEAGEILKGKHLGASHDNPIVYSSGYRDSSTVDKAELFHVGKVTIKGKEVNVKTVLQILKDETKSKTLGEWSEICGVPVQMIVKIAQDLYRNAPYSGTTVHRGLGMNPVGEYTVWSFRAIDTLLGNIHRKGGLLGRAGHLKSNDYMYDLKKVKNVSWGFPIDRHGVAYEESFEFIFSGYPAKRPWYPLTPEEIYTEAFAGIHEGYPYPIKALILYYANPVLSANYGIKFIETLKDTKRLPLFIGITTTINETYLYADYIVPDTTYLDGGTMGCQFLYASSGGVKIAETWRTPAVMPQTVKVGTCPNGHPKYASMWEFLIDVALRLGMPGFGEKAIMGNPEKEEMKDRTFSLFCVWEYIMRVFANSAMDGKDAGLIKEASPEEIKFVEKNYPLAQFKKIVPNEWKYIAYGLARGGVFTDYRSSFDENGVSTRKPPTELLQLWNEKLAKTKNSLTGKKFYGGPKYFEIRDYTGRGLKKEFEAYPFTVVFPGSPLFTKHRSMFYYWMKQIMPENFALIHPEDAKEAGIKSGDTVTIETPTGYLDVKAVIEPSVMKGVIAIPVGMGRWADTVIMKPKYFTLKDEKVNSLIEGLPPKIEIPEEAVNPVKALDELRKKILFTKSKKSYYEHLIPDNWRFSGVTPNVVSLVDSSTGNWPLLSWIGGAQNYFTVAKIVKRREGKTEVPWIIW